MSSDPRLNLSASDDPVVREAIGIVRGLREAGHTALFAGGCVRDWLLGEDTPKDVDIATSATPDEVRRVFPRAKAVGEAFGVMLVRRRGHEFEVATFRSDFEYQDGRRPESVRLHDSPRVDAQRRDFTINGLFYDPIEERVLDFVGGVDDLRQGRIRAIGTARHRFAEDHLRLLRAVRFAARMGFAVDEATWMALCDMAPKLALIAPERIKAELDTILLGPRPDWAFDLLQQGGLLRAVVPEIAALDGVPHATPYHPEGDVFSHVVQMLAQMRADTEALAAAQADGDESPVDDTETEGPRSEAWRYLSTEGPLVGALPARPSVAWAVLLHDAAKATTFRFDRDRPRFHGHEHEGAALADEIGRRLRFSNDERERVIELVRQHMRFWHVEEMRTATLKRLLRMPHIEEHIALHRLDCLSSHRNLDKLRFVLQKLHEYGTGRDAAGLRPPPLLTGNDLKELGYAPGPRFKEILAWLEDRQLEGTLMERDKAVAAVRGQFPPDQTHS